ncbi:MAG: ACT domain-containing protein [Nitrososphaeria archaeon]
MELEGYFKNGRVTVVRERFAVAESKRMMKDAFAIIQDKSEYSVVVEEGKVKWDHVKEIVGGWRLLSFDMVLPFELVGFLSRVLSALADEGISALAISSYSTDHILVKEENLGKATAVLQRLGFIVEFK